MKKTIATKNRLLFFLNTILLFSTHFSYSQVVNPLCGLAQPICTDSSNVFNNSTNTSIPVGPDYGCLNDYLTVPLLNGMSNPQWYYFSISNDGVVELQIAQYDTLGQAIDLDFAMWGPYQSLNDGCNTIMSGNEYPIQCSINSSNIETIGLGTLGGGNAWTAWLPGTTDGTSTPPPGVTGEIYIIIVSNNSNQPGTISLAQTSGDGALDCAIVTNCDINVTATPGSCDGNTNEFSVSGVITFNDEPQTGDLIVEDCNGNSVVFSAPFTSPLNYTIPNINSDGNNCRVSAYFTDDPGCIGFSDYYNNPIPCVCIPPTLNVNPINTCNTADLNNAIGNGSDPANLTFYNSQNDANNGTNAINNVVNTAGTYWIRATTTNDPDCFAVYQVTVTFQNISYLATTSPAHCGVNDGEMIITVSGGTSPYTYSIDNGLTTQNNGTFNNMGAGSYQIYIEDANGCSDTGTELIGNIDGPNIENVQFVAVSCYGKCDGEMEITVSGGATPYTFSWTNNGNSIGVNTDHATDLCGGNYTVTITDDNNCAINVTQTIDEPDALNAVFSGLDANYCSNSRFRWRKSR